MKPFSQACENNKVPIAKVLREVFVEPATILEIGSGTGQHACYLAEQLSHLQWQPSDRIENLDGIRAWLGDCQCPNLRAPLQLDVDDEVWPLDAVDGVFSANTVHIMGWPAVQRLFAGIGRLLTPGGYFCLYGPFNYAGAYTSESNARFDEWLKQRDPNSGIRDFEALQRLGSEHGLSLVDDHGLPANNRMLVWQRQ